MFGNPLPKIVSPLELESSLRINKESRKAAIADLGSCTFINNDFQNPQGSSPASDL